MFRCQFSKSLSKSGESACKLVTHIRDVEYRRGDEIVGRGWEIVREVQLCKETHAALTAGGFKPQQELTVVRNLPPLPRERFNFRKER